MPSSTRREFLSILAASTLLYRAQPDTEYGIVEIWGADGEHHISTIPATECKEAIRRTLADLNFFRSPLASRGATP